jgi:hypothetical protein
LPLPATQSEEMLREERDVAILAVLADFRAHAGRANNNDKQFKFFRLQCFTDKKYDDFRSQYKFQYLSQVL